MQKNKDLKDNPEKELLFPAVGPALIAGLKDSVHPGALTGLLIFSVFLHFALREKKRAITLGLYFLAGYYLMAIGLALGILDVYLGTQPVDVFHDIVYFLIALGAIAVGVMLMKDWWAGKKDEATPARVIEFSFLRGPAATRGTDHVQVPPLLRNIFKKWPLKRLPKSLAFFLGGLMPLIESAWAPDVYVAVIFYELTVPGQTGGAFLSLLVYGLAFMLPLLFLWGAALGILFSENLSQVLQREMAKIQVIFAAVFLGYGFTFIIRYYVWLWF